MFDIGFWELAVIGVIALLVVGPERLPGLARNVGMWVGRIRRYVSHVKQDIERELHAEEVRELLEQRNEALSEIRGVAREAASAIDGARKELDDASRESTRGGDEASAKPRAAPSAGARAKADPFDADNLAAVSPVGDDRPSSQPADEPPSSEDDGTPPARQG